MINPRNRKLCLVNFWSLVWCEKCNTTTSAQWFHVMISDRLIGDNFCWPFRATVEVRWWLITAKLESSAGALAVLRIITECTLASPPSRPGLIGIESNFKWRVITHTHTYINIYSHTCVCVCVLIYTYRMFKRAKPTDAFTPRVFVLSFSFHLGDRHFVYLI